MFLIGFEVKAAGFQPPFSFFYRSTDKNLFSLFFDSVFFVSEFISLFFARQFYGIVGSAA